MRVLFTMTAIIETENINNNQVKIAIERSVRDHKIDNIANAWAQDYIERNYLTKETTLKALD